MDVKIEAEGIMAAGVAASGFVVWLWTVANKVSRLVSKQESHGEKLADHGVQLREFDTRWNALLAEVQKGNRESGERLARIEATLLMGTSANKHHAN